jgi:tetratricopeptide (TPR) repeat protein
VSNVAVVCPKCAKRQELSAGVAIPPQGLRHMCTGCSAVFLVRAPRSATKPVLPAVGSAPHPGAAVPAPGTGTARAPAPAAAPVAPSTPFLKPLKPSGPSPGRGSGLAPLRPPTSSDFRDLSDLPASRADIPRPDDLLASRADIPRPDDLPASRADIPRPDDLPASRADIPRPDDLLAAREDVPRPANTFARRPGSAGGAPSVDFGDFGAPAPSARPAPAPAPRAASPGLMDIFLGDMPSASASPLAPLDLDFGPPSQPSPPSMLDFGLSLDDESPAGAQPEFDPFAPPPSQPALDLSPELAAPAASFSAAPRTGKMAYAAPAPRAAAPPPEVAPAGQDEGLPLDLLDFEPIPSSSAEAPPVDLPAAPPSTMENADLGFSLDLAPAGEPSASAPSASRSAARASAPAPASADDLPSGVKRLAPPRTKVAALGGAGAPQGGAGRKLLLMGVAVGVVAVLGAAAVFVIPMVTNRSPGLFEVLAPFAPQLARDHYPAYQRGADALLASVTPKNEPRPRAAAAQLLLLAGLAHGDKAKVSRAEQLLLDLPATAADIPELGRARALLAVAKNRGRDVETILGAAAQEPDAQLITGLRRLREAKPEQAVAALRTFTEAAPESSIGQFVLGRALEESGHPVEALVAYRKVLAVNPDHAGAQIAVLRLGSDPPEKVAVAARALLPRVASSGSSSEVGDTDVQIGRAALALGRTADAVESLGRAVAARPESVDATIALGEALIADGRPGDALVKLRAGGAPVAVSSGGRLALGGALISTGLVDEGLAQVRAAARDGAKDPRVPFWMGVAAELRRSPDQAEAVDAYKTALGQDPRFLPATLRLGALLERQGHADDAIGVLKAAEKAGAPSEALELAWAAALVAGKNGAEAERVLKKALARSPKLVAAHLGLASALSAQGKDADAVAALEAAVAADPQATGLREPLATLLVKAGKPDAALAALEAEVALGKPSPRLRVVLGKLALQQERFDLAKTQLEAAVDEQPGEPEALFTLGQAREGAGDREGALREYRRALAFESSPGLHLSLGRALLRLGKEDEAMGHFDAAGPVAPARLERARLRLRRGQVEEALVDAQEAVKLAPGDASAHLLAGLVLDKMGRAQDAATAWETAVKLQNDLLEAHYRLGRFEMDQGRAKAALPHLRQAAAKVPQGVPWAADLQFQLGTAEAAAGSRGGAAVALKKYLEVAPPDAPARSEVEKQLARLAHR